MIKKGKEKEKELLRERQRWREREAEMAEREKERVRENMYEETVVVSFKSNLLLMSFCLHIINYNS
jgi:hypothetical protein